jgi:hypothetical protein
MLFAVRWLRQPIVLSQEGEQGLAVGHAPRHLHKDESRKGSFVRELPVLLADLLNQLHDDFAAGRHNPRFEEALR